MLKDLRDNPFVRKQPWTKSKQQGLCANKDCMETGTKECSRCGIRYCSEKCQNMDWKHRHKNHCEVKDVRRTEIIFGIHKNRLEKYKTGETSRDRYYSIALFRMYEDYFSEAIQTPAYQIYRIDKSSGRILTVLEDHEIDGDNKSNRILRGGKAYLVNPNIPSVPLSHEEEQLRLAAGLTLKEATELVPLNENIQVAWEYNLIEMIKRSMRNALYQDLKMNLFLINISIVPGMGWGYGNPVFLSLKNALAYEDFIRKNFGLNLQFPFYLCCSILFPEFNLSMRTGNPEDADKLLDLDSEDNFVDKTEAPALFAEIFDAQLMGKENKEENDAFKKVEGETENDRHMKYYTYLSKCDPLRYARFNLAEHCSESLAVCTADQSAFTAGQEGCQLLV